MNALQDYLEGDTSTAKAAQERMDAMERLNPTIYEIALRAAFLESGVDEKDARQVLDDLAAKYPFLGSVEPKSTICPKHDETDFVWDFDAYYCRRCLFRVEERKVTMEQNTPLPNTIPGNYPGLTSWVEPVQNEPTDYIERAKSLVRAQVNEEMFSTGASQFEVYVVWFCKTLQNWKAIICTTMPDGMLYEVTHNGDKRETYIDAYRKQSNTVVPD